MNILSIIVGITASIVILVGIYTYQVIKGKWNNKQYTIILLAIFGLSATNLGIIIYTWWVYREFLLNFVNNLN